MKNMVGTLSVLIGIAALLAALYMFYQFVTFRNAQGAYDAQGGTQYLWSAIGAAVIAFICGLVFFVRRVNKEEEIHITQ